MGGKGPAMANNVAVKVGDLAIVSLVGLGHRAARVLRADGENVWIRIVGLDTTDPVWGEQVVIRASQVVSVS